MKKDFSKKSYRHKPKPRSFRVRWYGAVFTIIVLIGGAGFWFVQHKTQPAFSPMISAYATRTQQWISERKNRLQDNLKKVKRVAVSEDDPPPIQFEFYTALPNMQTNMTDLIAKQADAAEKKIPVSKKVPPKKLASNPSIFDADQLQQALNDEFNHPRYSAHKTERE